MSAHNTELLRQLELRKRAAAKLGNGNADAPLTVTRAYGVLHDMASSSATAANAMALLHELQVHQVELELQHEELQGARADIEADLNRQTQRYDFAPVALYTVDQDARLIELNHRGATLLGDERHALVGQALVTFLTPDSMIALNSLLDRLRTADGSALSVDLTLRRDPPVPVRASVSADPAGKGFLLSLT